MLTIRNNLLFFGSWKFGLFFVELRETQCSISNYTIT